MSLFLEAQVALVTALRIHLQAQKALNPTMSLRGIAHQLGMSSGALSELLRGKRPVSKRTALKIVPKLSLSPADKKKIYAAINEKNLLNAHQKAELALVTPEYTKVSLDQFEMIAGWEHFAILSLMKVKGFQSEVEWIASRLGIRIDRAKAALKRIESLGLAVRLPSGRWKRTSALFTSEDGVSSQAIKQAHLQSMDLARKSLLQDPVERRDFSELTLCVSPSQIPQARERIRAFQDELSAFLETEQQTDVYKLTVYLYPITRTEENQP